MCSKNINLQYITLKLIWMHEIIPGLWLSDAHDATSASNLSKHKISAIMNATKDVPFCQFTKRMHRARVAVDDDLSKGQVDAMYRDLPRIVQWVDNMMKARRVTLVHCFAGVQRSACVVAAYLMYKHPKMEVQDAVEYVRSRRPVAFRPYANFRSALNRYKKDLDEKRKI